VLVVSNPPWGKRLDVGGERDAEGQRRSAKRWGSDGDRGADFGGEDDDDSFVDDVDDEIREEDADETQSAWHSLGAFFRRECAGATAHLLSGDAGATRPLKMRAKRKRVLGIGGVDCRLLEYRVLPPKREKNLDELVREAREEEAI
jgi:23S rRNA G2445 N2-methylase RlmL